MKANFRWVIALPLIASLQLTACRKTMESAGEDDNEPVKVVHRDVDAPPLVILTELAAKRIDLQTEPISDAVVDGTSRMVMPYSAVLYDTQGATWAYTNPESLTFVRHPVTIAQIDGGRAYITDGPPLGTLVVKVGAQELYGSEFEFEEE